MFAVKYAAILKNARLILQKILRLSKVCLVQCNNTFRMPRSFGEAAGPRPGETHYCSRGNAASLDVGTVPRYWVSPNNSKLIWIFYVMSKAFYVCHSVRNQSIALIKNARFRFALEMCRVLIRRHITGGSTI